ncbi:MAG: uridylate kinase [Isosphaeraceae bacterium]|nr:uridylate kinase [Isosphaeraceae bacterium]
MNTREIVVVKLGGSLLDLRELPERLAAALAWLFPRRHLVIVGGGGAADVIRRLDHVHQWTKDASHALAIRSLDLTASILASLVTGSIVVEDRAGCLAAWESGRLPILAPRRLLETEDRGADALPSSWDVTTDSIAARVARILGARTLLLLKSVDPPRDRKMQSLVDSGFVDAFFPIAAESLASVWTINLRDDRSQPHPIAVEAGDERGL